MASEQEMAAENLMLKERLNRAEARLATVDAALEKRVSQLTELREKLRETLESIEE